MAADSKCFAKISYYHGTRLSAIFTLLDYVGPPFFRRKMGDLCTLVSHSFLPVEPLITCPPQPVHMLRSAERLYIICCRHRVSTSKLVPFFHSTKALRVKRFTLLINGRIRFVILLETMIIIFAMIVPKKVVCAIVHQQTGTPQLN